MSVYSLASTSRPSAEDGEAASEGAPRRRVVCFSIHAEAEPGVMPRVLELFAKRGLVPCRWVSDVIDPRAGQSASGGRALAIDLQVEDLSPQTADYIARCLRQLLAVETVLTSEKRLA